MNIFKKFHNWRKRRIEKLYFKMFPQVKIPATMEIIHTNVMPKTYYSKRILDPFYVIADEAMKSVYLDSLKEDLVQSLGMTLLKDGMIDIRKDYMVGEKTAYVAVVRVIPPETHSTYLKIEKEEENENTEQLS